jgi:hypothetical protein
MNRMLMIMLLTIAFAAPAYAKEVGIDEVAASPSKYAGKPVVMTGIFAYSEPMRESFTLDQDGSMIEVFYRDLPKNDKDFILAQKRSSKTTITVNGMLQQYANSDHSVFIVASSMRYDSEAQRPSSLSSNRRFVSYDDVQASPQTYVNKQITMKGIFAYGEPVKQSMTFSQDGMNIAVLVSDLSKADRERILAQKPKTPVIVTGEVLFYVNDKKMFYLVATAVEVGN